MPADNKLTFAFNTPVRVALIDPLGDYDDDLRQGKFQTTCGQWFTLPRPAVEKLYGLDPKPGEELQITRYWSGKPREPITWDILLTPVSEQERAAEEIAASERQEPSEQPEVPTDEELLLQASLTRQKARNAAKRRTVEPIQRKPAARVDQPRLFDQQQRGTGTDGPTPVPATRPAPLPAVGRRKVPYQDVLRQIVRNVKTILTEEQLQLGDEPTQRLIVTVYIDASKKVGVEYDFSEEARP